jgi:hypothetical protein
MTLGKSFSAYVRAATYELSLYWPKEKDPTILGSSWNIPGAKKVS